jgi:G3E family GTPase
VRDDLVGAIKRLLDSPIAPERIVVEASGLADPAAMIRSFFLDSTIQARTHLDAIVTIVDLRHIMGHWNTREACEQIVFGDVVLLNKADLVTEPELFAVRDRIRRMNPYTRMYVTNHCDVPLETITGVSAFNLGRALTIDAQLLDDTAHEHDDEVSAVCVTREGAVDVPRLTRFLHAFGQECAADLFRVKGIMNVTDERKRLVVQGMHTWLETQPGSAWQPQEPRTNRLVLIGRALDRPSLEQAFAACIAPPAAAARPHI